MQPTVDSQLAAVRRTLGALTDRHDLPAEAGATLDDAAKALGRIERSWAQVLPYLAADNAALDALLADLAPSLPAELEAEVGATRAEPAPDPFDVAAAGERNAALRELVARAILASEDARPPALRALRESVERRPW